jgi:hypothetical protein
VESLDRQIREIERDHAALLDRRSKLVGELERMDPAEVP